MPWGRLHKSKCAILEPSEQIYVKYFVILFLCMLRQDHYLGLHSLTYCLVTFDYYFCFHSSTPSIFLLPFESFTGQTTTYLISWFNICRAGCKGELGILMDESGSIGDSEFVKEKNFVTNLANGFTNFGTNGVQMGVITYSTDAELDIKLKQYSNKMNFIDAVKRIRYRGRKTGYVVHVNLTQTRIGSRWWFRFLLRSWFYIWLSRKTANFKRLIHWRSKPIGLMRDYVRRSKFTTKPRLH